MFSFSSGILCQQNRPTVCWGGWVSDISHMMFWPAFFLHTKSQWCTVSGSKKVENNIFQNFIWKLYKGIGGEFSRPLKVQAWACPVQRLSQTLTWPTVWRPWGIVGISAGLPWFDCGPASVSWAGTPSGTLRWSCRQGGSVPTAAGARRPVDRGENGSGLVDPGPCFRWRFRTTFMMTGVSKL